MSTALVVVLVLAVFLALLMMRLHVGLALALAGGVGVVIIRSTDAAASAIANQPFAVAADYSLTVIPLFILMGVFAIQAGLADAGFRFAAAVLGRLPGGEALSSLAGSGLFAAVTGSSVATVATMARVSTEAICKAGLSTKLAAGVVCAGGTLGVLIPPSIILVLYGVVTGENIGQLLLAGIGPGLLTLAAYAATVVIIVAVTRKKSSAALYDEVKAGAAADGRPDDAATAHSRDGKEFVESADDHDSGPVLDREHALNGNPDPHPFSSSNLVAVGFLFTIFAVSIGTIYAGVATPTEAASFGALTALIVMLIRVRPPQWIAAIQNSLSEAIGLTSMTFLLMFGAGVFTYFLALSGVSNALIESVLGLEINPYLVLILGLLLLLPLGMFLDGISMILVAAPLLHPIMTGYEFDGIWIAILVVKVAEMALITPPVGMNAFVYTGSVPKVGLGTTFRGIIPFILADLVVVAMMILVPEIVTFIPEMSGA